MISELDRTAPRIFLITIAMSMSACERAPETVGPDEMVCTEWSKADASSWPASTLELPMESLASAGMTLTDSALFVFDLLDGRITGYDTTGRQVSSFGRSGDGPGEFARARSTTISFLTPPDWIGARGDTLFAFDGRSIIVLMTDGTRVAQWPVGTAGGAGFGISFRMRPIAHAVLVDVHRGVDLSDRSGKARPNRSFSLLRIAPDSVSVLESSSLPSLPVTERGTMFEGPAEARPLWDASNGCLVMIDGSSTTLTIRNLTSGSRQTIELPLPERFFDPASDNSGVRLAGQSGVLPPPARLKRVTELQLDGAGWLWLRPAQPSPPPEGIEVWKYHLPTGRFVVDTVPAFARLLDVSGSAVGVSTDRDFITRLVPLRQ